MKGWQFLVAGFLVSPILFQHDLADAQEILSTQKAKKIAFFNPNGPGNTYWPDVFFVLEEVSKDLGFQFIHYDLGSDDRFATKEKVIQVLDSEERPDALIVAITISDGKHILQKSESRNTPVLLKGPIYPRDLPSIGVSPRNKYKTWVGLYHEDEVEKGYQLGKILIERAITEKAFAADGKIHVVGLGGRMVWYGSKLREEGLKKAVSEYPQAVLKQIVPTDWTPEKATKLATMLLSRFPETSVVWAASDQIAIGAAKALIAKGRKLGSQAFTGGLDFSKAGFEKVKDGTLEATVATPLSYYAQVIISLYDYLEGHDFSSGKDYRIGPLPVYAATRRNVDEFILLSDVIKVVDFKSFSKTHNPKLKSYDFSWEGIVKAACESSRENSRFRKICK